MRVFNRISGFLFGFSQVSGKNRAVGSPGRIHRGKCVKFDGASFFTRSLMHACVVAQVSTREFLLEWVLEIVCISKEFVTVEFRDIGDA